MRKIREQELRRAQKVKDLEQLEKTKKRDPTIKLQWSSREASYSEADLRRIFSPFGRIDDLLLSKKGNRAVLVYSRPQDAVIVPSAFLQKA